MDMPLLVSRLHIPHPPPGLLVRPRLFARLNGSATVTIVQAPAGWGKTVLLTSWLRISPPPETVGWISMESGDNAADFWQHMCAVLRRAVPSTRFPRLGGIPDRRCLIQLTQVLTELPRPLVLVVDATDHLHSVSLERDLDFLLQHAEGKLRLVAACRSVPPVPVHLWRLRGDLTEVGAAELAFTPVETADMLARSGFEMAAGEVELVQERSEGWPAGVRLAAVATQRDALGRPARVRDAFAYQAEYLTREVLADQPTFLQDVLLDTAILPRLCGGLLEAVTLREHGDQLLQQMLDASLFLVPVGSEPGWYRYHSLFAQVMRSTLALRQPARIPELHRRAASWFIEHDLPVDALHHAVAGQDWAAARQVLTDRWTELVGNDYPRPRAPTTRTAHTAMLGDPEMALACGLERLSQHDPDDAARYVRLVNQQ